VAELRIDNFPDGLYRLLQKLAAADGMPVEESVVILLYEAMYGSAGVTMAGPGSNGKAGKQGPPAAPHGNGAPPNKRTPTPTTPPAEAEA